MNAIEKAAYDKGHRDGYAGRPLDEVLAKKYPTYYVGHEDGMSDAPGLEELMGVDLGVEMRGGF